MEKEDLHISAAVSALAIWIASGTLIFHRLEDWTWIQAFYFSVATMTTVGYGDLVPTRDITRLCVAIYILSGVSVVVASLGVIGSNAVHKRQKRMQRKQARKQIVKDYKD